MGEKEEVGGKDTFSVIFPFTLSWRRRIVSAARKASVWFCG